MASKLKLTELLHPDSAVAACSHGGGRISGALTFPRRRENRKQ